MKIEIHFPEIKTLSEWWRSRRSRLRKLEGELSAARMDIARLKTQVNRKSGELMRSNVAGQHWAQRATTEITWAVVVWHVRHRVIAKREAEGIPYMKAIKMEVTEEEALDALRDMWRKPPVFAPPEEAKELAENIVRLHTKAA